VELDRAELTPSVSSGTTTTQAAASHFTSVQYMVQLYLNGLWGEDRVAVNCTCRFCVPPLTYRVFVSLAVHSAQAMASS
jgi:hypothetical protein